MIVSSRTRFLLFTTALILIITLSSAAIAQGRTAGTTGNRTATPPAAANVTEEKLISNNSTTLPANFEILESYGTLDIAREGAMGIDVWDNSRHSTLKELIVNLPASTPYRSINNLTRRALLTTADARLMVGRGNITPGEDLLTLRLEKLVEMGAFKEAASLYTANPGPPYHERLARIGLLSLLYSGRPGIACLEAFSLKDRFQALTFWKDFMAACSYLAGSDINVTPTAGNADSPLIAKLMDTPSFRYMISSFSDISRLSNLEKGLLIADSRMDYSNFKPVDKAVMDEQTASLLLTDPNLPKNIRFGLMRYALEKGIRTIEDMRDFYRTSGMSEGLNTAGWHRLVSHYNTAEKAEGQARTSNVTEALSMSEIYGTMPLLPFATYIVEIEPADLSPSALRAGLKTLILTDTPIPSRWWQTWEEARNDSKADSLLDIAIITHNEFSTLSEKSFFSMKNSGLSERETQITQVLGEKLDIFPELSEDGVARTYEKQPSLTLGDDYVMPSTSLVERLKEAKTDRRLGETVLLSALVLQNAPPEILVPGMLSEVLDGLKTVGLTEEARDLAAEVILGL